MSPNKPQADRKSVPHEAIELSQAVKDQRSLRLVFLDNDVLIEKLKWHTPHWLGMRDGKVVNKAALKYWEPLQEG